MTRARLVLALLSLAIVAFIWWHATTVETRLYALSAVDGRMRWSAGFPAATRAVGSPSASEGRVVVGTASTDDPADDEDPWQVTAFDAASGRMLWQITPHRDRRDELFVVDTLVTGPVVTASHVFIPMRLRRGTVLYAVDAASGQPAWSVDSIGFGRRSRHAEVASAGGRIFVSVPNGTSLAIRALDQRDGAELWTTPLERAQFPANDLGPFIVASSEAVFVGLHGGLVALDASTGAVRFDATQGGLGSWLALAGGTFFQEPAGYGLEARDDRTGEIRWTYQPPAFGPLRAFDVRDGLLVLLCDCDEDRESHQGWLVGIDATTGLVRWRTPVTDQTTLYLDRPVFAGDVVLTGTEGDERTDDSNIVARSTADGSVRWRVARLRADIVAADGDTVFAADRAPRWRHWLTLLGIARQP